MKKRRGLYPFIRKSDYYQKPTLFSIEAVLGNNRHNRAMFLLQSKETKVVTDFNLETMRYLSDKLGRDVKNWNNRKIVLEAIKWTTGTYQLKVRFPEDVNPKVKDIDYSLEEKTRGK